MAKEEIQNWMRTAVIFASIVFAGGGYAMKVNSNSKHIETNTQGIKENKDLIHKEEIARMSMQGDVKYTRERIGKIEENQEKLINYLMQCDFNEKSK